MKDNDAPPNGQIACALLFSNNTAHEALLTHLKRAKKIEATRFADAQSLIESHHNGNRIDVVLIDDDAHDENLTGTLRVITEQLSGTGVIVYSSRSDEAFIFACLTAGARGFLSHGDDVEFVIDGIEACASGGAPMSPDVARIVTGFFNHRKAPRRERSIEERMKLLRLLAQQKEEEDSR